MATRTRATSTARRQKKPAAGASPQIAAYVAALSPVARKALKELRAAIRAAEPRPVPSFAYRIPGFRLFDRPLVWCGAWANPPSLDPITPALLRAHGITIAG